METTRRWQRLEEIFHAALALDVEERPAYLAEACGDDDALRREAAELLESVGDADERIGGAVSAGLEVALEAIAGGVPETIGPYRILRELGEGGLANVYLGERTEGYTQQVAVKVLKRGMDTVDILRRLRQERQILADLDHPHIARLLDGGTTADGRPYVVMEHIEGEPIDDYCDRRGLTVQERLELFTKVCAAVHHAHRSLVIHRDIKPSNLLVTPEGNPKLLDFGIAKLLDPSRARATVAHTGAGIRWLTPGYASPEQVVGAPLTTATDIYSLGVLLYQLLTGRPPHRFPTDHPAEVERVMRDVEPQRPSAAAGGEPTEDGPGTRPAAERARERGTTPERLVKSLRGDLDNIVRMAMHAEPERRYASAEQLADDVANHLASMPVRARPETFGYYAAKFVRRHRGAVAAAVVVVLSLVGGIVGTTRALWIAETQRERAERLRDQSEEVAGFMIDLFRAPDPDIALGRDLSAWQLLENGAQRVEALDGQPLRQAALMHAMGRSYQNLGRYDEARSLLGRSLDRRREALGEGHPEVAGDLYHLASALFDAGRVDEAAELAEQALDRERSSHGERHPDVARVLNLLAQLKRAGGDVDDAEALHRRALDLRLELFGDEDPATFESRNDLGELLFENGRLDEAEALFRQSLDGRRRFDAPITEVAVSHNNLAAVLLERGDREGAADHFGQALEVRRRLLGEDHPHLAISYNNLGRLLLDLERPAEAAPLLERAVKIADAIFEDHPAQASFTLNLAVALHKLERHDEAEAAYLESLERRRRAHGDDDPRVALTRTTLANFYAGVGRRDLALELATGALQSLQRSLEAGDPRLASPLLLVGELLGDSGRCAEALPHLRQATALRRTLPEDNPNRQRAERALAECSAD